MIVVVTVLNFYLLTQTSFLNINTDVDSLVCVGCITAVRGEEGQDKETEDCEGVRSCGVVW
jgi:hypothetical protein